MKKLTVLVLEDEARVREEIEEFLGKSGYHALLADKPSEAFKLLNQNEVDIAILDIRLPEMSGLEVLEKVKADNPSIEVIMISGHGDMGTVIEAMRKGATDYFQKPFRLADLNSAILRTERFITLNNKLKAYDKSLGILTEKLYQSTGNQMLGESNAMKTVVSLMQKVAQTDNTSVLITGESGTGKELVAHGIHLMSSRSRQVFHSTNCSAITDSLFESEFFGHRKGSFTGAIDDRQGWFEIADKGTLFLDEVSDMPIGQQAKLLRVLEERKITRVGSNQPVHVDVRVIAASNQELEKMISEKKFRTDLYHRLSTFIIHLPPLRERREDIPLLLDHFVADFAEKMNKKIMNIDPSVILAMRTYHFPGNIRELRNMVERAVILCDGKTIGREHFFNLGQTAEEKVPQSFDLDQLEKETIINALNAAKYSKTKAAELLNISWQALSRRLKKYNLE